MVLDILAAAILIAVGVMAIYFSIESGLKDMELTIVIFLGIMAVAIGGWIILSKLTLFLVLQKLAGLILVGVGLFLVIGFPDLVEYQAFGMSRAGALIGLVLLIFGIFLLLF
ncbi:MAG: hypothetical protein HYY37_06375 [Candidatus Aenigmarchaeota archaeon]|nr:hypothetical protein [Candidatus Aenigmarchaeota archaeon]